MTTITDLHFGVCPKCHSHDGYINIGQGHWFYCREHKVRWFGGANLFDSWKLETDDEQRETYAALQFDQYREVEPCHSLPPHCVVTTERAMADHVGPTNGCCTDPTCRTL